MGLPRRRSGGSRTRILQWLRQIPDETPALYLALRHRETPWYAKVLAALVVAYAASPIDLIPDFIPIVGLLDDVVILPAAIALIVRLIPDHVMEECRRNASPAFLRTVRWIRRFGLGLVLILWGMLAVGIALLMVWMVRLL